MIRTLLIELATVFAYAAWAANVAPVVVEDSCDYIEDHTLTCKDTGNEVFKQQIFWVWDGRAYHVRAWRLVKGANQTPERYQRGWRVRWHDGEYLRSVTAPHWVETIGPFDPEVEDRDEWPVEFRWALMEAKRTGRVVEVVP